MALTEVGDGHLYSTLSVGITNTPDGGTVRANPVSGGTDYPEAVAVANKRIHLIGSNPNQGISISGAGGGAAAAVLSSGNGKIIIENFTISNVGSAATYVVQLNVAEDWFRRLYIDGGGTKRCIEAQFGENTILFDGTHGLMPSCPGQVIMKHLTCVQMTTLGLQGNSNNLDAKGCLIYDCNAAGFVNAEDDFCWANFSDDITAPGPASQRGLVLADYDFENLGAGDVRIGIDSIAWITGISPLPVDINGNRRFRETGVNPRLYGGAFDPYPASPSFVTGTSSIRSM